jgi:hypothetical protein
LAERWAVGVTVCQRLQDFGQPEARPARGVDDLGDGLGFSELRVVGVEVGDPAGEPVVARFLEMGCGVIPFFVDHHLAFRKRH